MELWRVRNSLSLASMSTCTTCRFWQPAEPRHRHPKPTETRRLCTLLSSDASPLEVVPLSMGAGPKVAVYTGPGWGCAGWRGKGAGLDALVPALDELSKAWEDKT